MQRPNGRYYWTNENGAYCVYFLSYATRKSTLLAVWSSEYAAKHDIQQLEGYDATA